MRILKSIILVVCFLISLNNNALNQEDVYDNPMDIIISDYLNQNKKINFALKSKEIKDTIGIIYNHFYPAHNGKPTLKSLNNWSITLFIKDGDREKKLTVYNIFSDLKKIRFRNIIIKQKSNIEIWLKQINIDELISKRELSYFPEQNIYGLYFFYYLIPVK